MLEVFLFINPVGQVCLKSEEALLQIISETDTNIHFKFIPLLNLKNVGHYMTLHQMDPHDLDLRNRIFNAIYEAVLAYKAATFQGNKKSRQFLMHLQAAHWVPNTNFDPAFVMSAAKAANLDLEMLQEDWHDSLSKSAFTTDQQLACEMNIQASPSAVVFNYACGEAQSGLLIEDCDSYDLLKYVCAHEANYETAYSAIKQGQHPFDKGKLRLLS